MENIFNNFKREIIIALALILIGAGYTASSEAPYNPYKERVSQIDVMMTELIANPTDEKLEAAYWTLWEHGQWSGRNYLEGKADFEAYLEECNSVRLSLKAGETADTREMIKLRDKLI